MFLSGNGIQPPISLEKNGLFTTVVADALRGKADTEGYEPDGIVTLDEAHKYVDKHIPGAGQDGRQEQRGAAAAAACSSAAAIALPADPQPARRPPSAEARLKKYEEQEGRGQARRRGRRGRRRSS